MTTTQSSQADLLREDIEKLDREIRRDPDPGRVCDWSAVLARKDRLRVDRARLVRDLAELERAS